MTETKTPPIVAIVEDDHSLRRALTRLLKVAGFDPVGFETAEEYIEAAPVPICVIVDVLLPGISGLELQQRLNAGPDPPPIIITTAGHEASLRERAERNGCVAFYWKPVDPQVLIATITAIANGQDVAAS